MRVLLKFKSANNLVLLADATPSARHFSPAETKHSFGGDFHLVFKLRLNPGNFVCYSRKGWRIPLMDGSTTAWAVLFTDGTLKRRGFHKFSSITPAESEPSLCTYFRSQIAISESRSVYCTLHLRPLCTSGFVTLYHPVCRVRRFAVEQAYFRNGSAIRTF